MQALFKEKVKTEYQVGDYVLFQASEDGRVEYGEIIATKLLCLYLIQVGVVRSAIFEKLVFLITSRILKILMEHKDIKKRLYSKLQTFSTVYVPLEFSTL